MKCEELFVLRKGLTPSRRAEGTGYHTIMHKDALRRLFTALIAVVLAISLYRRYITGAYGNIISKT